MIEKIYQHFRVIDIKFFEKETIYYIELPNGDGEAKICVPYPEVRMYGNKASVIAKYEHLLK